MISSSVIDKVRKLRQLAQSSNVNEAANAAAAAERLIQEHRIAEAELSTEAEEDAVPVKDFVVEPTAVSVTWRGHLIVALCKSYSCAVYASNRRDETGRTKCAWALIGTPADIETTKYQYTWLTTEIVRLANSHPIRLRGKGEFNSFYLGAVAGISEAIYAADNAARSSAYSTGQSASLVKLDARLARAKEQLPSNLRAKQTKSNINRDAYDAGKTAGASIHRGSSLVQGGTRLLA